MSKLVKGIFKVGVAAAAVAGVCYLFKDDIKDSKFYQEHDVDNKIKSAKKTIKDKMPKSFFNEEDIVEEDEVFFDDNDSDGSDRDYVSIDDSDEEEKIETDKTEDIPTIEV